MSSYNEPTTAKPSPPARLAPSVARCNYVAADVPSPTDDFEAGYQENSVWYIPADERLFVCVVGTVAAAVWLELQTGEDVPVEPPQGIGMMSGNVALQKPYGAVATATSEYSAAYGPALANDGIRHAQGSQKVWNSLAGMPQTWEVNFGVARKIYQVDVITQGDNYNLATDPPRDLTFTLYGLTAYNVDYFDGTAWHNLATVTGNNLVWRTFEFDMVTATKVRVVCLASPDGYARLWEVEVLAFLTVDELPTIKGSGTTPQLAWWLRPDELASTPRLNATGSGDGLAINSRMDVVPASLRISPDWNAAYYASTNHDALFIDLSGTQSYSLYGGANWNLVRMLDQTGREAYLIDRVGAQVWNIDTMAIANRTNPETRAALRVYLDAGSAFYAPNDIDGLRIYAYAGNHGYYSGTNLRMIRCDDPGSGNELFHVWDSGRVNIRKCLALGPGALMDNSVPAATLDILDASGLAQLRLGYNTAEMLKINVTATGGVIFEPYGTVPSLELCQNSLTTIGVWGASPVTKPTVSGTRSNPDGALTSLLVALAAIGWIDDATTA